MRALFVHTPPDRRGRMFLLCLAVISVGLAYFLALGVLHR